MSEQDAVITCKNLVKVYRSGNVETIALRGLDLQVHEAEFRAIMGPSGSGKTTLLNLISGVDTPTAGQVIVDGEDIARYPSDILTEFRRQTIGMVFQFFNLVPYLTAQENVELPMRLAGASGDLSEEALRLLELTGVAEKASHRPSQLSGGEQQRVAIAVALANDPPILLADEPTAELDSINAYHIAQLFAALNRQLQKTIIIVTHDPKIAAMADRISLLEDGLVTETLTPEELAHRYPVLVPASQSRIEDLLKEQQSIEARIRKMEQDFKQGRLSALDFAQSFQRLHKRLIEIQSKLRKRS